MVKFGCRAAVRAAGATAAAACALLAQSVPARADMEVIVVEGRRPPAAATEQIFGTVTLDASQLATAPSPLLDDALRQVPGVDLFRRSNSRSAHPTSQGLSVRGIGPNGAGRVLVLVDDVPANDPFGGWTYWSRLPSSAIEQVDITKGSGAGPWGNTALAGVVRIRTRPLQGAEVFAGSDNTYSATAGAAARVGNWSLSASGSLFRTDGFDVVRKDQRGPVDQPAWVRSQWGQASAAHSDGDLSAALTVGAFSEDRGNGSELARNSTRIQDASLRIAKQDGLFGGPTHATLYGRLENFSSTFTSINAARTTESVSLNQHDVPASGYGVAMDTEIPHGDGHTTTVGLDLRGQEGATHEYFLPVAGAFTREREAGGSQLIVGAFAEHEWAVNPALDLHAGVRVDNWRNTDGRRTERVIATGADARNDHYGTGTGWLPTARGGAAWRVVPDLQLRASVYTGFRVPTLNELYRPFRVGNDTTEANPALRPERLWGIDAGAEWQPVRGVTLGTTFFHTVLRHAVDNVLLANTPGFIPEFNTTLTAGGTLSQRRNLSRITVDGLESEASAQLTEQLTLTLRHLWTRAVINKGGPGATFANLDGNRVGQTPRHSGSLAATWRPDRTWTLRLSARAGGSSFEDSTNSRSLAPYVVADAYVGFRILENLELFGSVENLTDRTVETGKRGDGLVNVGAPREWHVGLRASW
jgi:outer membrane receptor protein involved in Fe transport